jgi:SAM-dependent methyltransferase
MKQQESLEPVDEQRWHEAQRAERELWERSQVKRGWKRLAWPVVRPLLAAVGSKRVTGDDHNRWWAGHYDGYSFLPDELGDVIELGCGPYTNTRVVLQGRTARRIVCSDPLIETYVGFSGRWLAEAYRAGRVEIDAHPIEECPFSPESFDVVVMINVLEHVRDPELCMRTAAGLVRSNGYLIVANRVVVVDEMPYDVWHPIRIRKDALLPFLEDFEPIVDKDVREGGSGFEPEFSHHIFAGRKRAGQADAASA